MQLSDYSFEDLHQMATAEFENDPEVVAELTALYRSAQAFHIECIRRYREKADKERNAHFIAATAEGDV